MENFVKRIEEEVRNEEELKKEDSKIGKMIGESSTTTVLQKKRKMMVDSYSPQKKSCIFEEVSEKEEKELLVCSQCTRKLKITNNYSCRCGNTYCIRHRFHDQHSCTFDYKAIAIAKLEAQNPKVVSKKIGDF